MEQLAVSAVQFLAAQGEGSRRLEVTKALRALASLVAQYPGGLSEAIIITELFKLVQGQAHTIPATEDVSSDDDIEAGFINGNAAATAPQSAPADLLALHDLIRCHSRAPTHQAVTAEAVVCLVDRVGTGPAMTGPGVLWAAHLSPCPRYGTDTSRAAPAMLRLYLHSRQSHFLNPDGPQPWLQGKRVRLARPAMLTGPSELALQARKREGWTPVVPTAAPTLTLLPVLSAQQWKDRATVLQALAPGPCRAHSEVDASFQGLLPGGTTSTDGWVVGTVVEVQATQALQTVVMLQAEAGGGPPWPLVLPGPTAALAAALKPRDRVAAWQLVLQAALPPDSGLGGPPQLVLWATPATVLVAGPQQQQQHRPGAADLAANLRVTAAAPVHVPGVWGVVHRLEACTKTPSGWQARARLRVLVTLDGASKATPCTASGPFPHLVDAQLACTNTSKVVASLHPGHHVLLMGASVALPSAAPLPGSLADVGVGRLSWDEASPRARCVDLSCLPALLSSACLFRPSLLPPPTVAATTPAGMLQEAARAAAAVGSQPAVACIELQAVRVQARRVHRVCGRVVSQSLDMSDFEDLMDIEVEAEKGNGQGPTQSCPGDVHLSVDPSPSGPLGAPDALGAAHPGLWHCSCCVRDVAGTEVCWAFSGTACIRPSWHPCLNASAEAWTCSGMPKHPPSRSAHTAAAATAQEAAVHVEHAVMLEHAALVTLCGASVDSWQRLTLWEQSKRLSELQAGLEPMLDDKSCTTCAALASSCSATLPRCFLAALSVGGEEAEGALRVTQLAPLGPRSFDTRM